MKLYSYFRSSAAYRVRIALNLKSLAYELAPIDLLAKRQRDPGYLRVNPMGLVPALDDNGTTIGQSLAIIEYLDDVYPQHLIRPADPARRALDRSIALTVACDIHPLNNLRVLGYLTDRLGLDQAAKDAWYRHWVTEGLAAIERLVVAAPYATGPTPGYGDVFLVPQLFNARRFDVDVSMFPKLVAIDSACNALEAFARAHPSRQPDAPAAS
jgi:maleylacetoacetate isomerase/maleylpyruvate isomerase